MTKGPDGFIDLNEKRERAIVVGIDRGDLSRPSSLEELERLAYTANVDVVYATSQRLSKPNPAYFIGSGKAGEIADLAHEMHVDVVIFDDELSPTQQSNLERILDKDIKVIDRTALILDIFALHAKSHEGRLQVRLAQNEYLYPRLRGMWAHLASNRMGGGVGSRFGEGESQLEVDRRIVRKRITQIKRELKNLQKTRNLQRETRLNSAVFKIALAGYTNAGKSSLLNRLCGSEVYSDDLLFATLDSTTRRYELPIGRTVTLTDTVGFIQKLPTTLIEAFKSSLDEVSQSDLILHVIDASSSDFEGQIDTVETVFGQINASAIPKIYVFNKIDLLDEDVLRGLKMRYPHAEFISTKDSVGIAELIQHISLASAVSDQTISILVPFDRGDVTSFAHEYCTVITETYSDRGTQMTLKAPAKICNRFQDYIV